MMAVKCDVWNFDKTAREIEDFWVQIIRPSFFIGAQSSNKEKEEETTKIFP